MPLHASYSTLGVPNAVLFERITQLQAAQASVPPQLREAGHRRHQTSAEMQRRAASIVSRHRPDTRSGPCSRRRRPSTHLDAVAQLITPPYAPTDASSICPHPPWSHQAHRTTPDRTSPCAEESRGMPSMPSAFGGQGWLEICGLLLLGFGASRRPRARATRERKAVGGFGQWQWLGQHILISWHQDNTNFTLSLFKLPRGREGAGSCVFCWPETEGLFDSED